MQRSLYSVDSGALRDTYCINKTVSSLTRK